MKKATDVAMTFDDWRLLRRGWLYRFRMIPQRPCDFAAGSVASATAGRRATAALGAAVLPAGAVARIATGPWLDLALTPATGRDDLAGTADVVNGSFQRYTVAAQARTPMPMTRRNVPRRCPMARPQSTESGRAG